MGAGRHSRNLLQQSANSGIQSFNIRVAPATSFIEANAGIAQLVEQLICNQQVVGSNPTAGSLVNRRAPQPGNDSAWTLLAFQRVEKRLLFAGPVPKFTRPPIGCHLSDG
jgi:hypothetical protein